MVSSRFQLYIFCDLSKVEANKYFASDCDAVPKVRPKSIPNSDHAEGVLHINENEPDMPYLNIEMYFGQGTVLLFDRKAFRTFNGPFTSLPQIEV